MRAGNALRQLEDKGLAVTNKDGEWVATTDSKFTAEEANAVFDRAFPGLGTITKQRPQPGTRQRSQGAQPNKEANMATKSPTAEFTKDKDSGKPAGVKGGQVIKMIAALRKSEDPIAFDTLCKSVDAKYPQDVQAAMFALEVAGLVDRYSYVDEGSTRSRTAYKWAASEGDDAARPTKSTTTASRTRSRGSKQAKEETTPAAA